MSYLKDQEELRDSIAVMLELSRASWHTENPLEEEGRMTEEDYSPYPRSLVFKTIYKHPMLCAAAVGAIWYFGPAKFSAMAVAGASLFLRHKASFLPLAQNLLSASVFKFK